MKKRFLILIFAVFMVNLPSFAIITPEEATSASYIKNHGYSDEMTRLMDLQDAQFHNKKPSYKEHEAWYSKKLPKYTEKPISFIRRAFIYLDCGLDDGTFGQENINPTSRWDDL